MAKNVQSLQLLRNSQIFADKATAIAGITSASTQDGVIKLARYTEGTGAQATTKTIFGIYHDATMGGASGYTIYDSYQEVIAAMQDKIANLESGSTEIMDILGGGVSTANTVTDQLEALSGDAQSSSADTSVEGAKKYAEEKIAEAIADLDNTSDAAVAGQYITYITETDGIVSAGARANISEAVLNNYAKGSDATAVASTDTVNQAISKLENQIDNVSSASTSGVTEINNKLGTGVTTANTATQQFAALSGTAGASSADTSVEGAKSYADAKIGQAVSGLDYTDTAVAKKFVTEVDETDGVISVQRGEITSSGKTIVLSDGNDGGVNFDVNIDGLTIIKDASTGVLSVANSALVEYIGDEDTINVSTAVNNQKTISSLLSIKEVTTSVPDTVAHRYMLAGTGTTKIGEYIDIPKDSALANFYLGHVDDVLTDADPTTHESPTSTVTPGTGDTALVWIMQLSNGNYKLATVDVHSFIDEAEFASGVTWDSTAKKVKGVVDGTSEGFLTVGADGFKLSGVQTAIDNAVSGATAQTAELSAKTVTEVGSSNSSITATLSAATDGTKHLDVITDASKVKMTGFTADASGFTAITTASTVTEAVKVIETEFLANEQTTAQALNDLEARKLENIVVNGVSGTVANKIATVTVDGSELNLSSGYTKAAQAAAVATGDTVDVAIGKLEKKIDDAVAGGVQSVTETSGITVNNTDSNNPVIGAKLSSTGLPSGIAENAIKFDSTENGMYVQYIDAGTY